MEEYQSGSEFETSAKEDTKYEQEKNLDIVEEDETDFETNENQPKRKSFVWKYFRVLEGGKTNECIICNGCVGNQTSNLARHLALAHDITKLKEEGIEHTGRSRPTRSIIWKYCTREDAKRAHCHLCNKLLYFGGGNTGNIVKHLRRKHPHIFPSEKANNMDETSQAIAAIEQNADANGDIIVKSSSNNSNNNSFEEGQRKERRGGSYVWNYCVKISRHTIRCKLCNKIMSFHGTANVITHLQRKHNVLGKMETGDNNTSVDNGGNNTGDGGSSVYAEESSAIEQLDETAGDNESFPRPNRRSTATMSVVWKYCKRLSKETVRCGICKKNLSYQGTSNLQRHLHRMHSLVTQGRAFKSDNGEMGYELPFKEIGSDFIWEHCTMDEEQRVKCNMCNAVFENNSEEIIRHLTFTHAIIPRSAGDDDVINFKPKRRRRWRDEFDGDMSDDYEDFEGEHINKNDGLNVAQEFHESNIKKDDSFYDDIIEEEHGEEDPFDANLSTGMPIANPLSAESSRCVSPDPDHKVFTGDNKRLKKLNEDRVRMETEYFREKAGFYRMQKYLTALQAKKVRFELERFNNELNGVYTTVDVGTFQQNIPTQ